MNPLEWFTAGDLFNAACFAGVYALGVRAGKKQERQMIRGKSQKLINEWFPDGVPPLTPANMRDPKRMIAAVLEPFTRLK